MGFLSVFVRAWTWLKKDFTNHIIDADKIAVFLTETAKSLLASKEAGILLNFADAVLGSQVPTQIANTLTALFPKILAVELAIEGLPDNATPDQVLAFEQDVLKAFNVTSNNSKLYTTFGAQVYGEIQIAESTGNNNFAGWVNAIERAYADLQKDLAANAVVATPPQAAIAVPAPAPDDAVNTIDDGTPVDDQSTI